VALLRCRTRSHVYALSRARRSPGNASAADPHGCVEQLPQLPQHPPSSARSAPRLTWFLAQRPLPTQPKSRASARVATRLPLLGAAVSVSRPRFALIDRPCARSSRRRKFRSAACLATARDQNSAGRATRLRSPGDLKREVG
jgi:hypothetical protein